MISFTFEMALAVRVMGAFLVTSGTLVVVAICISLALKMFDYSKTPHPTAAAKSRRAVEALLF
jgi:hypothetical protein